MFRMERQLPELLGMLRWVIPAIMAALGMGYVLLEHLLITPDFTTAMHTLRTALIIGTIGPTFTWMLLTWVGRIARSRQRAEQTLERQALRLQALYKTSLDIVSHLDSQQVLHAILERAADLLNAQGASLGVCRPETKLVHVIATYPPESPYQGITLPMGEGVLGKVLETGEPLIVNEYLQWDGRSETFRDAPYSAVIGVPLRWQGKVTGCLVVLDQGDRRPFRQEDSWLLSAFADLASIALKNADLYNEVKGLTADLEQRVAIRTNQLATAEAEVVHKAEQLQGLLRKTFRLQEEERARIARDMHDSTTQLILGALYTTQAAKEGLDTNPAAARENMAMVQQFLQEIEAEIRQTIHNLRSPSLDSQGIVPALKQSVARFEEITQTSCTLRVTGKPLRLTSNVEIAIYRIVQEALQNVAAHAKAGRVWVGVHYDTYIVHVTVNDDGQGFEPTNVMDQNSGHFGLIGMEERAEFIGARLQIDSIVGQGTRIVLDIPVSKMQGEIRDEADSSSNRRRSSGIPLRFTQLTSQRSRD